jgi:hypothetical protein
MDYFLRYLDLIHGRMSAMILLILVICRVFWVCIVPAKGYSVLCWPIIVLMLCVCVNLGKTHVLDGNGY